MKAMTVAVAALLWPWVAGCTAPPDDPPRTLRVLSYNIRHGLGNDDVLDLTRAAAVMAACAPDVVAVQEVDRRCGRSGGVDQAAFLGQALGMEHRFGAFMEYDGGEYGMAVLSALPVLGTRNHVLPPGAEPRSALALDVRLGPGGPVLTVVGIHLYATAEERMAQARRLVELLGESPHPVLLVGDFNSTPDSEVMRYLSRHWSIPDKGPDHLTFSSDDPHTEIDYVLFRPEGRFRVVSIDVLDEPLVSDHRPLLLVLEVLDPGTEAGGRAARDRP